MNLERLVYTTLMEERTYRGWNNKATIDYIIENEKMIKKNIGRSLGDKKILYINSSDIDDIYSEILLYLYEVDDYNISKAIRTTDDGKEYIIPLEGYVFKSIEFCIKRYITNKFAVESLLVNREVRTSEDNNILDLLNNISDSKSDIDFETVEVDLNQHCRYCESMRYSNGIDIYQVWYIGLLVISKNLKSDKFDVMMNILGIKKKDLRELAINDYEDGIMLEFAMGINKHGIEESLIILEQYIYSAEQIKKAIDSLELLEVV